MERFGIHSTVGDLDYDFSLLFDKWIILCSLQKKRNKKIANEMSLEEALAEFPKPSRIYITKENRRPYTIMALLHTESNLALKEAYRRPRMLDIALSSMQVGRKRKLKLGDDCLDIFADGDIFSQLDLSEEKTKPGKEGWWINEKYNQYKIYYIHPEAFECKLCKSGGRWYFWRDMKK